MATTNVVAAAASAPATTLTPLAVPELSSTVAPANPTTPALPVQSAVRPPNPPAAAVARPVRERADKERSDAQAPSNGSGEDPPRYRTSW